MLKLSGRDRGEPLVFTPLLSFELPSAESQSCFCASGGRLYLKQFPPAQLAVEIQAEPTLKVECLCPGDFFFKLIPTIDQK